MKCRIFTIIVFSLGIVFFQSCGQKESTAPEEREINGELNIDVKKNLFFQESQLTVITDIVYGELDSSSGIEIGIASSRGVALLDQNTNLKSLLLFAFSADHVDFFDVNSDGIYEYINRGSWSVDASLIDNQGKVVWIYGGFPQVDDMSAGDMDLDGIADFVVGYNGDGGVHLVDIDGNMIWEKSDSNVWHVEFVDTDGDGKLEIVHSNAAGQITVRDRQGNIISRAKPASYFSRFSICKWPTQNDDEYVLFAGNDTLWIYDFYGNLIKLYNAPEIDFLGEARSVSFTINDRPGYFAVVVNLRNENKAVLYIFNPQGQTEHHEILPEASAAIAAVDLNSSNNVVILVGGNGKVWGYSFEVL